MKVSISLPQNPRTAGRAQETTIEVAGDLVGEWTAPVPTTRSSNVAFVRYRENTRTLEVTFRGGSTYRYSNVAPTTWESLIRASSVGKFLHQQIKSRHRAVKVR